MSQTSVFGRPALFVGLTALALYLPSLANGFAFDDVRDIRDNPAVVEATGPLDVVTSPYRGAVPPARSPYRPLTSLSYWLNWVLTGDDPVAFHALNVLLHVLASVLVVRLLFVLGAPGAGALAGGLVFAVHPVHVEAVANVVGRADVLMTVACLAAALVYLSRTVSAPTRAAFVAAMYALALGAKENGVVLPALLALLVLLPGGGPTAQTEAPSAPGDPARGATLRRELLVLAPSVAVLAAYLAVRYGVLGTLVHRDTAPYIAALPAGERITTAVANLAHLARLLVVPVDLVADYGPAVVVPVGMDSPRFWVGVVTAAGVLGLGAALLRRDRLGALAVAWAALSVLIVSNLAIPIGVWVAERTLYLPSVGIALGVAAAVGAIRQRAPRHLRTAWVAVALVVVAGAWRSLDRIPSWESSEAMLATLAEEHPESFRSQWWLARRLTEVGDFEAGLGWFEQARATNPNDLGVALDHVRALLLADRPEAAETIVAALPPTDPARFVYLAQSRIMTGRPNEARDDVRAGLERFPRDARLLGQARELGVQVPDR